MATDATAGTLAARIDPKRGALGFLAVLGLWALAAGLEWVDPRFLPAPLAVAERAWREVTTGTMPADLLESLRRNLAGFVIGSAAGVVLGIALGFSRIVERIVGPTLTASRQVALFAWVPLLSVWFGGADAGKIAFISVAAFQPVVMQTWAGVRGVPQSYRELARVLTLSRLDFARYVALPGALPAIFTGLHGGLIYAWLATLGSELFMNVTPGIGGRLNEGSQLFQMDLLFLGIIVLATIGLAYNAAALGIERLILARRSR